MLAEFKPLQYIDICDCLRFGKKDAFNYLRKADKKIIHTESCKLDALQILGASSLIGATVGAAVATSIILTCGASTPAILAAFPIFVSYLTAGEYYGLGHHIAKEVTTDTISREANFLEAAYGNNISPTSPLLHFLPQNIVMEKEITNIN